MRLQTQRNCPRKPGILPSAWSSQERHSKVEGGSQRTFRGRDFGSEESQTEVFPKNTVLATCVQMDYIGCGQPGHRASVRKAHGAVGEKWLGRTGENVQKVWGVWLGCTCFHAQNCH